MSQLNDVIDIIDYVEITLGAHDEELFTSDAASVAKQAAEALIEEDKDPGEFIAYLKDSIVNIENNLHFYKKYVKTVYHPNVLVAQDKMSEFFKAVIDQLENPEGNTQQVDWSKLQN